MNIKTQIKATVSKDTEEYFNLEIEDLNAVEKWDSIRQFLLKRGGIRSITKSNVKRLVENENYTCIDVRDSVQFNRGPRIEGAINIPLFTTEMDGSNAMAKKVLFSLLPSIQDTYLNKHFTKQVFEQIKNFENPVVVACNQGGNIAGSRYFPKGIASRSLIAAAILIKAGFKNVAHVNGGVGRTDVGYERPFLLEFFYGKDVPFGAYSEKLMYVSLSIPFLILFVMLLPKMEAQLALMGFFM